MKTKAVIFDFDGTLTRGGEGSCSWARVWKSLDDEETDNKFYGMFARGEIDDPTWMRLIEERYKELKMPKSLLDGLAEKIELMPGLEKTLKHFYDNGVKVYVVSGGVKNLIDIKLEPFKKFITRIEGYQFNFKNGIFCGFKETKDCLDDKHKYVDVIKQENNIVGDDILFVGNGAAQTRDSRRGKDAERYLRTNAGNAYELQEHIVFFLCCESIKLQGIFAYREIGEQHGLLSLTKLRARHT